MEKKYYKNLKMIVCVGKDNLIGDRTPDENSNGMLWHIKEELMYFKERTMGNTVLFGGTTAKYVPVELMRKNREVIVLHRTMDVPKLIEDLTQENDIILIEQDAKILEKILANNDIMGFVGSGVSYDAQMEAEVPKADVFIAVTEKDEINIIASVIAKKLGAKYTIARVRSTDYSSQLNFMTESLGIDLVINPELEAAKDIKQNIDFPEALNVENFLDGRLKLVEFHIDRDSILDNVSLFDFKQKFFPNLLVCIIKRGDEVIIPSGNSVIKGDDRIYITGSNSEIIKFQDALGKDRRKIKSAFIIGAGIISHYLAEELLKDKIAVKIVEMNPKKARKF